MHIQYLGLSSFKLTTKEAVVIIDPYSKESGIASPRGIVDVLILSEPKNSLYSSYSSLSGEPFIIGSPGEYDVKGVTVTGIPLLQNENYVTVFLIESEGVKILNLTHIHNFNISEDELEDLGDIDILILPVGGNTVLDASTAAKIVNQVGAKMVIPSHFATEGIKLKLDDVSKFVKEMGGKAETLDKIIVKQKDFTDSEDTKVVILTVWQQRTSNIDVDVSS